MSDKTDKTSETNVAQTIDVALDVEKLRMIKAALIAAPVKIEGSFGSAAILIAQIHSTIKTIDDALNLLSARIEIEQLKAKTQEREVKDNDAAKQ